MTSGVYDKAMVNVMTGLVNIPLNSTSNTYPGVYDVLTTSQPPQTTGTTYADITNQHGVVNGYETGGMLVNTVVPTMTAHVTGLGTGAAQVFTTTGTITAEWAIIQYAPTAKATAGNPLLCFLDMGPQSVTNGTLTLTWNAAGIFTLTVAPAS
jgi:hypothetical protein